MMRARAKLLQYELEAYSNGLCNGVGGKVLCGEISFLYLFRTCNRQRVLHLSSSLCSSFGWELDMSASFHLMA